MAYQLLPDGGVRLGDTIIPPDPKNPDWRKYQESLAAGNTPEPADLPSLDDAKAAASTEIDQVAEATRLRFITGGAGQAMTYQRKEAQALAYALAGYLGAVPGLVQAVADAREIDPGDAANLILAKAEAWAVIGTEIELYRESGKLAVEGASTHEAIETARDEALLEFKMIGVE